MNNAKVRLALLALGSLVFAYGAWFLPRPLMALALASLVIFLMK